MPDIPPSAIGTVSPILAEAYTHSELDTLFMSAGFPGDPPQGNKIDKCRIWLRRANTDCDEPLALLGRLVAEFMDTEPAPILLQTFNGDPREKIQQALARDGLSYKRGGYILGASLSGPSRSLAERIKGEGIEVVEREYHRAYQTIDADPAAAVTAASAILESVCKAYLEQEGVPLPSKQVLATLWVETAKHLGLTPKDVADDDLKIILQGLYSIAGGVAALRTHEGSAHGRSSTRLYKLEPRHARLAVHAAHTMALFILETREARDRGS